MTEDKTTATHVAGTMRSGNRWVGTCQGCPWVSGTVRAKFMAEGLAKLHANNANGPLSLTTPRLEGVTDDAPPALSRDEILDRLTDVWNDLARPTYDPEYRNHATSEAIKAILSDSGR